MPGPFSYTSSSIARCLSFIAEAFTPSGTIVLPSCPGAEYKIGKLVTQNRLLALILVERLQQSESIVALSAERAYGFSVDCVIFPSIV